MGALVPSCYNKNAIQTRSGSHAATPPLLCDNFMRITLGSQLYLHNSLYGIPNQTKLNDAKIIILSDSLAQKHVQKLA